MKAIIITLVALLSWCSTTQAATALPTIDEIQQIKKTFSLLDDWELNWIYNNETNSTTDKRYLNNVVFNSEEMSVWTPFSKSRILYEYNTNNDKNALVLQTWDGTSTVWNNAYRQQIAYSKDGNLQAVTLNTWNPDENTWFAIYKDTYIYTPNGSLETASSQMWNIANDNWNNTERKLYNYNVKGYLTTVVTQTPDANIPNFWHNKLQNVYNYDKNGNEWLITEQTWNNDHNTWNNAQRDVLDYTPQQDVETAIVQNWDNANWDNLIRQLKSYDNEGNLLSVAQQTWNPNYQMWESLTLEKHDFDTNGRAIQTTQLLWNNDNQSWTNANQQTYIYDDNRLKAIINQYWNEIDRIWENDSKSIFTYLLPFTATPTSNTSSSSNEIIIRSTPNQTLSIAPTNSTKKQK